jgi:predicted nucleotide-binding protein
MIARFTGPSGRQRLVAAMMEQKIVRHQEPLAIALADVAELIEIEPQAELIAHDSAGNDIYLILAGRVAIRVHRRELAIRHAGEHVGEMALIDPTAPRSASVFAVERTVLARISERYFTPIASAYPDLWRELAKELAQRLRQRNEFVQVPNDIPRVLIGSSAGASELAEAIHSGLGHVDAEITVLKDDILGPSSTTIEGLAREAKAFDFAVLVLSRDDIVPSRGLPQQAPRDNVAYALGLLTGALGRERTYLVTSRGMSLDIPSDLFGVTPLSYPPGDASTASSRLAPTCTALREAIQNRGPK